MFVTEETGRCSDRREDIRLKIRRSVGLSYPLCTTFPSSFDKISLRRSGPEMMF